MKTKTAIHCDNIKRLQNLLLTSKNLAVDNCLRSYLKRCDNQVSIDFHGSIAILNVNLIKAEAPKQKPGPVMWYGYYPGEQAPENTVCCNRSKGIHCR